MTAVVAYMPGEPGDAALEHGIHWVQQRGGRLVVVNGTRGDALVDTHYSGSDAWQGLDRRLAEAGVEHDVRQPMGADGAELVLDVAREVDAAVVVVGLRRRTPIGKLIMGSVSQRLLLEASCPVLAVHADDPPGGI